MGELIRRRSGVRLAVRTAGKSLARRGFTARKPIRRAYGTHPAKAAADEPRPNGAAQRF